MITTASGRLTVTGLLLAAAAVALGGCTVPTPADVTGAGASSTTVAPLPSETATVAPGQTPAATGSPVVLRDGVRAPGSLVVRAKVKVQSSGPVSAWRAVLVARDPATGALDVAREIQEVNAAGGWELSLDRTSGGYRLSARRDPQTGTAQLVVDVVVAAPGVPVLVRVLHSSAAS